MAHLPPDENDMFGQVAYPKGPPDEMPRKKPGDRYTLSGALVGTIVGLYLGIRTAIPFLILAGLIGGGIIGTVIGAFVGSQVVKYRKSREGDSGHLFH